MQGKLDIVVGLTKLDHCICQIGHLVQHILFNFCAFILLYLIILLLSLALMI